MNHLERWAVNEGTNDEWENMVGDRIDADGGIMGQWGAWMVKCYLVLHGKEMVNGPGSWPIFGLALMITDIPDTH